MSFTRCEDDGLAGFEIMAIAAVHLNAHSPLDDKEPLRAGVTMPVRSCTVGERHPVHADRNAGLVVGETLDGRLSEEGCGIDRTCGRVTRLKRFASNDRTLDRAVTR
jgi:hypothetical protein